MNKKEYLLDLLTLCTARQKLMFCKMYPNGVEKKHLDTAISQIKNTILGLNNKCDKLNQVEEELTFEKNKSKQLEKENIRLNKEINQLENEIDRFNLIGIENVPDSILNSNGTGYNLKNFNNTNKRKI